MHVYQSLRLRATLSAVMRGRPDGWVHWMGVKCSTWVTTSRGSTGRSPCNPLGLEDEVCCVSDANLQVARTAHFYPNQILFRKSPENILLYRGALHHSFPPPKQHHYWFLSMLSRIPFRLLHPQSLQGGSFGISNGGISWHFYHWTATVFLAHFAWQNAECPRTNTGWGCIWMCFEINTSPQTHPI